MNTVKSASHTDDLLCRTCLKIIPSANETIYVFNNYLEDSEFATLVDFIGNFTSIQIHESDELSPFICIKCYEKLKDIHDFRKVCIVSNEFLVEQKSCQKLEVKTEQEDDLHEKVEEEEKEEEEHLDAVQTDFFGAIDSSTSEDDFQAEDAKSFIKGDHTEIVKGEEAKKKPQTKRRSKPKPKHKNQETENRTIEKHVKIVCEICQKVFFKQHNYDGHMRKHRGLKQFPCEECGKDFAKKASLKHHMEAHHPQETDERDEYICGINDCGKIYSIKQSLKNHIFSVHVQRPSTTQRVVCEHCGKSFTSISGLKKHAYIHTGAMPFKCHLCPKTYPTNHKLKVHIMRHEGIKNHVCPTCGLRKTTMHELRVHMNYHTREKQYPCKICPAIFSNIGNMSRHMRIVHCGIKAFPCKYCDRTFGKGETLKHHEMTHTGEKPHACNVCGKRFIQSVALKTHMRTHNKVRPVR